MFRRQEAEGAPWKGEIRFPDFVHSERISNALDSLDKAARAVASWQDFYAWLGRGSGWATFRPDCAAQLVPHWLSPDVNYHCLRYPFLPSWVEFADATIDPDRFSSISTNLVGPGPGDSAYQHFCFLTSNMVLTIAPLFQD